VGADHKALEREVRELRQANEILRKASAYFARTLDDLWRAVGDICALFTSHECWNYFKAAGCVAD